MTRGAFISGNFGPPKILTNPTCYHHPLAGPTRTRWVLGSIFQLQIARKLGLTLAWQVFPLLCCLSSAIIEAPPSLCTLRPSSVYCFQYLLFEIPINTSLNSLLFPGVPTLFFCRRTPQVHLNYWMSLLFPAKDLCFLPGKSTYRPPLVVIWMDFS